MLILEISEKCMTNITDFKKKINTEIEAGIDIAYEMMKADDPLDKVIMINSIASCFKNIRYVFNDLEIQAGKNIPAES